MEMNETFPARLHVLSASEAENGCLFSRNIKSCNKLSSLKLLHDFNDMTFTEMIASY